MTASIRSLDEFQRAADRVRALPVVRSVDVLELDPRVNQPVVEIVAGPELERDLFLTNVPANRALETTR